ncbi:NAD/NADP octopine/nopaline dehydrogenase family protein [Celeribacter sp.]|uniref:NAD/NADP octopine/nopaline dehydrogenase family protein n=1 Tax=Celeribacter sp. TaxID=1890673 RepID=UPI003A8F5C91
MQVSADADVIGGADGVILATSADRYQSALEVMATHITDGQPVLIGAELSQFSASVEEALSRRGRIAPITALSTTLATGRREEGALVKVGLLRNSALAWVRGCDNPQTQIDFWSVVTGVALTQASSPLHLTLSNLNPIVHVPNALCNFTRIERGEDWSNYGGITEGVARLIEALDSERLALARALGLHLETFKSSWERSNGFTAGMPLSEMSAELHQRRNGLPKGPVETSTRYLTEDVPFGLATFEHIGAARGVLTPVTSAAISMTSVIYGRSFRQENPFLDWLD